MSQEQKYEEGTRVLSEEEVRDFDGTTIDEEGRTYDAPHHQSSQQEQQGFQTIPNMKVFLWNALNWKWKAGLAVAAAVVIVALFVLAKFIIAGAFVIILAWLLMRLLGKLFF
ncbi:hypothetical protein [Veillonella sp. 3310]|jgi:hypothetical protein|uniref:hypothetical protein n=1 Tax=Veillonella sp. 3310 TaxID=2490956 RepID=UPI000FD6AFC5|nr:hypothetical protein [Veillonella sp. 3310]